MFAQGFDLARQHRVGAVGQRHQAFAQHQPQLVEVHGVGIDLRHVLLFLCLCISLRLGLCRLCRAALDHHAQAHHGSGQKGEDQQRKARQKADAEQQQSRHVKRLGEVRQLVKDRLVRRAARAAFGHDQTGGERHYQRRNLAHQPVPDSQRGKDVKGIAHTHAALHDADEDAADDVDQRDNEPRHRIAAHEFRRTVHGTEKRAFVFQFLTAATGLVFVDQSSAHIGIDRHLFARHRIEREPRGNLGDTGRTLCNHNEVDDHEDGKDHHADDEIARHDELGETLDYIPRRMETRMAFAEDQPG